MATVYPPKIDIFLAAESLRQEIGGKVTIIGAFVGGQIVMAPDTPLPAHMPLAILAAFYGGEGDFETKLRITGPSGEKGPDLSTGSISKVPNQAMQVMVNFGLFVVETLGKYKIDIVLNDNVYTEYLTFSVSDRPLT